MKTYTIPEFITLLNSPEWNFDSELGDITITPVDDQELTADGEDMITTTRYTCGAFGWVTATLGDIKISYSEAADWDEAHPEDYETTSDHGAETWYFEGLTVVDEDGDELSNGDVAALLDEHAPGKFESVDWPGILPEKEFHDADEDADMNTDEKTIVVERAGDRDIRFVGELIGEVSSSANNASSNYSGSTGRWSELRLYRSRGGKLICEQIGKTQWIGEHDRCSGAVCDTEAEVIAFFGLGWLAKELYDEAGIDYAEAVE